MAVAIILLLVAVGSVLFHLYSPWWWTPLASNWRYIDDTITLTFWITGAVFFAVVAFMAYCVFRFHHKEGRRAAYNPENKKLEWWLSIGTAIGVAAMLAPGLVVWHQFVTVPADATEVEVMGQQWMWSYRLPGRDGRLGTTDARNVSSDNPMGLNRDDPNGQDDVARVPGEDGYDTGLGYLLLVHAHPHRNIRGSLCGTVRCRACADAEQGRRRGRERISRVAGEAAHVR